MHKKKDCNCPACNPVIKPKAYEETPKPQLTLKEKLAQQRLQNHLDSEARFSRIMANGKEHAAHRAKVLAERGMAKTGFLDGISEGITDAAHYVGGITKTVGDTVTSSVEAVFDNPRMIKDTADNMASTIIDGVTYFPDAVLEEVAPELSYGARDRTDQRISNVIGGVADGFEGLERDYDKHQQAIEAGDFESAGSIVGGYVSSAMLPAKKAKFGTSISNDYKKTFFDEHPDLKGKVVVHHAVEQQVQRRYPDLVTDSEMHSLDNLRGIPKEKNGDLHLSKIRKEWNRFYKLNPNPNQNDLLKKASEIDQMFGNEFNPPIKNKSE